ncbi:MAG: MFS transporter [Caldilineaceae bacterium]|nr:MFS transporter [Caldilineaceae bacterium]
MAQQIWNRVDRPLLAPKIFYFCFYAAGAALMPFLPLFYAQQGISGSRIGLLTGLPPLISLLSAPLWGGFADVSQQHRRALLIAIAGSIGSIFLLAQVEGFLWLLPVVILYAFFMAPVMPLVDASVLMLLGERKDQYGKQRLWGAVGWGIAAPVIGWLIGRTGITWAFYGYILIMGMGLLAASQLRVSPVTIGQSFWRSLRGLLVNPTWTLFLLTAFIAGMGLAVINNFFFLYLEHLGFSAGFMGLSLTVSTLSELPVMFFADRLLRRWGARWMLMASLVIYVIRTLGYSLVTGALPILLIQLLHGPTFSLMWMAGVAYADEHAPPGLGATAQGLLSGMVMGLGAALGAILGGMLYQGVGPILMFRAAALGVSVGLLIFWLAQRRTLERG